MLRYRKTSAAFTLLELIVVLVILAVLATIAVPTFAAVIDRSHDRSAEISLSSYARSVQAHAALKGERVLSGDDFSEAAADFTQMAAAPGVSAAAYSVLVRSHPIRAERFDAHKLTVVSYALSNDGTEAGVAAVSAAGNCVGLHMTSLQVRVVSMPDDPALCTGRTALDVTNPGTGEPIDPANPGALQTPDVQPGARTTTTASATWAAVPGATSYTVEVSEAETMSNAALSTTSERTVTFPSTATTPKYLRVAAVAGTSQSKTSKVIRIVGALEAPQNAALELDGRQATVSWTPVAGATGYRIYQDGSAVFVRDVPGGDTDRATFTLAPGQTASFVVKAYNLDGESGPSNSVNGTVTATTPSGVVARVDGDEAIVSWSKVDAASGYEVYRNGVIGATVVGAENTSYRFPIEPGETLRFAVRAYDPNGQSAASGEVTATRAPAAPTASHTADDNVVTFSWTASTGATGYKLYLDAEPVATASASTLSRTYTLPYASTHTFKVVASNLGGDGPASNTVTMTVVPAAPTGVTASATETTATVSWTPVSGADGYRVYSTTGTLAASATGQSASSASFTLPAGSSGTYVVRAYNAGGESVASASATTAAVPTAPATVSSTISGTTVTVTWARSDTATDYELYKGAVLVKDVPGGSTTSTTTTIAAGEAATFSVRAKNGAGKSAATTGNAVTAAPAAPTASHTANDNVVTFNWTTPSGATSYKIYLDSNAAETVTATSKTYTLPYGTTHTFKVHAVNAGGDSVASNTVTMTVVPAAPTGVTASTTETTATVSWTPVSGAEGYRVYTTAGTLVTSALGQSASSASFNLPAGSSGTYVVKAYNAGGESVASAPASTSAVPTAPATVSSTISGTTVTVTWSTSSTATSYELYKGAVFVKDVPGGSTTSTTTTIAAGETATFSVRAKNTAGKSAATAGNSVTAAPAAPTASHTANDNVVTFNWDAPSGATSYKVYLDSNAAETVTGTSKAYTLAYATTHTFKVHAVNAGGDGPASNTVTMTVVPAAPTGVTASATETTATVKWTPVTGANGYHVYNAATDTQVATIAGQASSQQTVSMTAGETVSYYVKAYGNGGLSKGSNTASTSAVPTAPATVSSTISGTTVTVTWSTSNAATSYELYKGAVLVKDVPGGSTTSTTTTIDQGETATFSVRAKNTAGKSAATAGNSVTAAPAAPTVSHTANDNVVTFTWTAPSGATSYKLYLNASPVETSTATSKTYTLPYSSTNTFKVIANNAGGDGPASNTVTMTVVPAAPTGVSASATETTATVKWAPVTGANGYHIYDDATGTQVGTISGQASSQQTVQMSAGEATAYHVKAYGNGGLSRASAPSTAYAVPTPPATVSSTVSGTTVTVTWSQSSTATAYELYRGGVLVKDVDGGSTTSTTTTIGSGETATFSVLAKNTAGKSAATAGNSVTAAPTATTLSGSATGTTASLSWTAVSNATSYSVYRNGTTAPIATGITTLSYTQSGLVAGTSYSYRVVAVSNGVPGPDSNTVTVTTVPPTPAAPTATLSSRTATVTWTATATATSHSVWRSIDNGSTWTIVAANVGGTSYSDGNLDGYTYQYAVTATNNAGTSARSAASNAVTPLPAAPTGFTTTRTELSTEFTVNWDPVPGATSYTVNVTCPPDACSYTGAPTAGATGWYTNQAQSPYEYVIKVTAHNSAGNSTTTTYHTRPSYSGSVKQDAPIGYYKLDEASGAATAASPLGTLPDLTYGAHSGGSAPTRGVATLLSGAPGRATTFPASGTGTLGSGSVTTWPTGALTVEAWVKCTETGIATVVSYASGTVYNAFTLTQEANGLVGVAIGDKGYRATGVLCDGTPNQIAATWAGGTSVPILYLNGKALSTSALNTNAIKSYTASGHLHLGQEQDSLGGTFDPNQALLGTLDEVSIYNKVLSSQRIAQHYRAGTLN